MYITMFYLAEEESCTCMLFGHCVLLPITRMLALLTVVLIDQAGGIVKAVGLLFLQANTVLIMDRMLQPTCS